MTKSEQSICQFNHDESQSSYHLQYMTVIHSWTEITYRNNFIFIVLKFYAMESMDWRHNWHFYQKCEQVRIPGNHLWPALDFRNSLASLPPPLFFKNTVGIQLSTKSFIIIQNTLTLTTSLTYFFNHKSELSLTTVSNREYSNV